MVDKKTFEINISNQDKIVGDVRFPEIVSSSLPVVIVTHGFTGHKDWGFIPFLSEKIASEEFVVISYNFSTDIIDTSKDWFLDVDKFASFTISQEVKELHILVEHIKSKEIFPQSIVNHIDSSQIFLIGQSLGGAVSLIYAAEFGSVEKIVLLGTVGTLFRYTKRQIEEWEKNGVWFFTNSRTGQELKINYTYYQDLINSNYFLENFISRISVPILFIHGEEDLTVPKREIIDLIRKSKNPFVELKLIENTGHTFGVEHPFEKPTPPLFKVIDETLRFLKI
ncbi:MAG: alpha/beta hydrolase [Ignavibacteria bacterium]|nr:alpha/beta hydrolase [Ignavibacteria bacterium]